MLEAIDTLDNQGLPGTAIVRELAADLFKDSEYNFASKLNKRVQYVIDGSKSDEQQGSDHEGDEPERQESPKQESPKEESPKKEPRKKEPKSVDDLLSEIV